MKKIYFLYLLKLNIFKISLKKNFEIINKIEDPMIKEKVIKKIDRKISNKKTDNIIIGKPSPRHVIQRVENKKNIIENKFLLSFTKIFI